MQQNFNKLVLNNEQIAQCLTLLLHRVSRFLTLFIRRFLCVHIYIENVCI